MHAEDQVRLRHIIDAAEANHEFVSGRERSDLDTDRMLLFAIVRAIEVIGEAAARVSEDGRRSMEGIPWPDRVDARSLDPWVLRCGP